MQTRELGGGYRITVSEMSRKSQLAISTWFNAWFTGGGSALDKLHSVSAISTQIILHSRVALYRESEKLPDGVYEIDGDVTVTLPLTEACLNDLPASLVMWLIDVAGRENAVTLENFLAGVKMATARGMMTYARLSASGPSSKQTPL